MICLWKHRAESQIQLQTTRNPALDGKHRATAAFPLEKISVPNVLKAGLAQGTTWKITAPPGFDLRTVQLVPTEPCWPK